MIQTFKGNFTKDDIKFVDEMHARFPEKDIAFKFNIFYMLKPEARIEQARNMRKSVIRTGWHRRGIPYEDTETVDEHIEGMKTMTFAAIPGHPELQNVIDTIEGHDNGEVIISDFDKEDKKKISKPEKRRLESLAMGLIYESKPDMVQRWIDFEERKGFAAKFAVDIDAVQMCKRRLEYAVTHPYVDLTEFDDYFEALEWQTDEGKALYQKLVVKPS